MSRLILIPILLVAACSRTPDEQLIRNAINEMELAVQNRQTRPVLEHLADGFRGPQDMNAHQVRQLMAAHYFRNKHVYVVLAGMKIRVTGNDAEAVFNAAVSGGAGRLPERLQYYDVTTTWRKLDGDWRVIRADWKPSGQG